MKRRKAIRTILLAGSATVAGVGGYEWYSLTKNPDKNYLRSRKNLLEDLAETIIPSTHTPGARDAGAVEFMMRFLEECTDDKTLNRFVSGLQELETYTQTQFHKAFTECSEREKTAVLTYFDLRSRNHQTLFEKAKTKLMGRSFYDTLKSYTVEAYCISEKGATMGMRYIAVPGRYLPCTTMEPNQTAWATK